MALGVMCKSRAKGNQTICQAPSASNDRGEGVFVRMQQVVRACEGVFVRLRWSTSRRHAKQYVEDGLVDVKSNERGGEKTAEKRGETRVRGIGEGKSMGTFTYLLRGQKKGVRRRKSRTRKREVTVPCLRFVLGGRAKERGVYGCLRGRHRFCVCGARERICASCEAGDRRGEK